MCFGTSSTEDGYKLLISGHSWRKVRSTNRSVCNLWCIKKRQLQFIGVLTQNIQPGLFLICVCVCVCVPTHVHGLIAHI